MVHCNTKSDYGADELLAIAMDYDKEKDVVFAGVPGVCTCISEKRYKCIYAKPPQYVTKLTKFLYGVEPHRSDVQHEQWSWLDTACVPCYFSHH